MVQSRSHGFREPLAEYRIAAHKSSSVSSQASQPDELTRRSIRQAACNSNVARTFL
jgi:hypothetical protein